MLSRISTSRTGPFTHGLRIATQSRCRGEYNTFNSSFGADRVERLRNAVRARAKRSREQVLQLPRHRERASLGRALRRNPPSFAIDGEMP